MVSCPDRIREDLKGVSTLTSYRKHRSGEKAPFRDEKKHGKIPTQRQCRREAGIAGQTNVDEVEKQPKKEARRCGSPVDQVQSALNPKQH